MPVHEIYTKLRAAGLSRAGALGMIGNLRAESSLVSNIAQRGMTALSDAAYTEKYDKSPAACIRDGVGYGLAQWTYPSRKQALSDFARSRGKSVGDKNMQLDFIVRELKGDFPGLYAFLCDTDDIYAAADRICREFERPAVNNVERRYQLALEAEQLCKEVPKGLIPELIPLLEQLLELLRREAAA